MRPNASRVEASFYVDRRLSHSINKGDVLNVYRKKRLSRQTRHPIRIYIRHFVDYRFPRSFGHRGVRTECLGRSRGGVQGGRVVRLVSPAKLVIESHTDSVGDPGPNLKLSEGRAGGFATIS